MNKQVFTDKSEWLESRKQSIGSSEIAAILGMDSYATPYDIWLRKTGRAKPFKGNAATQRGHLLEDAVAQYFEIETGHRIIKRSAEEYIVRHDQHDFVAVSPDREYFHKDGGRGVCECKTTLMDVSDGIPRKWFAQLNYQLGTMGLEFGAVAHLSKFMDFGYEEFDFDPVLYDRMINAAGEFMRLVEADTPPEAMRAEDILKMFDHIEEDKIALAEDNIIKATKKVANCKQHIKDLKAEQSEAEEVIKLHMRDAARLETNTGDLLATWKEQSRSYFDKKAAAEKHPDIIQEFTEQRTSRVFRLKVGK